MASDRSQNGDIYLEAVEKPKDFPESGLPYSMKDPKVFAFLDNPDSLLASTDFGESKRYKSQFLLPYGHDHVDGPEKRSTSWPAVPRSQAFIPLHKRIESFQRRCERLETAREQVLSIRMELKFLRNNYRQQHKFVDESQRNLNDHIEEMMKTDDFITTRDEYLLRYGRARDDYLRLAEQSSALQALENDLTTRETSIERQEVQLKQTSYRILGVLRHLNPATRDEGEERDVANTIGPPSEQFSSDAGGDGQSTSSSASNPLLDEYFDRAGDVKVAKSRLLEVLKEHEEKRADRNHQQDQGLELQVPDVEFERTCEQEHEDAAKAIRDAIILKDRAKATCRENGIDTDQHRHTSDVLEDIVEEPRNLHGTNTEVPFSMHLRLKQDDMPGPFTIMTKTGPFGEAMIAEEDLSEPAQTTETVERWIESMDENLTSPSPVQVTSNEMTPRNESPSQVALLIQELEPYFVKREDAETIAQLVVRRLETLSSNRLSADQLASSTGSSTLMNHSRSSSEPTGIANTNRASSQIDFLRKELQQYLLEHGSAEVIEQLSDLGIEVPTSTKENINHMAAKAKSTLSDHSRTSSESRLSSLLRTDKSRTELIAGISERPRGRRP